MRQFSTIWGLNYDALDFGGVFVDIVGIMGAKCKFLDRPMTREHLRRRIVWEAFPRAGWTARAQFRQRGRTAG